MRSKLGLMSFRLVESSEARTMNGYSNLIIFPMRLKPQLIKHMPP